MNMASFIALVLGSSFASGVNLYLTVAALGIAHRMEYIVLPSQMADISHPLIITLAIGLYLIEFVADKVPFVDSAWDSVHTFIRPLGGAALAYMAMGDSPVVMQTAVSLLAGGVALNSHLTKATARAAINTSPEPVSNSVASVTEDVGVLGTIYLVIKHPVVATVLIIILIIISFWFLKKMFKFLKKVLQGKKKTDQVIKTEPSNSTDNSN